MSLTNPTSLVLIPALLCDEAMYREVIALMEGDVVAQVHMATRATMAANVAEILERAPERFVLGGSSYGGTVAIEVALAAPDRVAGLWLNDCDPGASDPDATLGLAGMLEQATDAAVTHLSSVVVRPQSTAAVATFKAMANRMGGHAGASQARALAGRSSAWERLGELTMPALVLWGDEDAAIPLDVGRRMSASLPNSHFHLLEHCGHLPALEQPEQVALVVREWMEDLPRRPTAVRTEVTSSPVRSE